MLTTITRRPEKEVENILEALVKWFITQLSSKRWFIKKLKPYKRCTFIIPLLWSTKTKYLHLTTDLYCDKGTILIFMSHKCQLICIVSSRPGFPSLTIDLRLEIEGLALSKTINGNCINSLWRCWYGPKPNEHSLWLNHS